MEKETLTGELHIKEKPEVIWYTKEKKHRGEEVLKNMGVAAALVLCAVTLKSGAIPTATDMTDAVLASVTDDTLLDDRLGKLSFVSSIFPEATLVFGEQSMHELALPVSGGTVVHAWNQSEPYTVWKTGSQEIYASSSGVVMGIYHGPDEELIVHVTGEQGMSCLYGNLADAAVEIGEQVSLGDRVGTLMESKDCVFELRQDGISVDPAAYLKNVT